MITLINFVLFSNLAFSAQTTLQCPDGSQLASRDISNGKIEECLSASSGKVEGPRYEYDTKNNLRRSWNFKNGIPDGEFKVYGDKKAVLREGRFVNGRLEGKMTRWYGKNQIQDETHWENGRPHGVMKRYYKNGKVMESGAYQAGRRVGVWKFNKDNGTSLPDRNYGSEVQGDIALENFGARVKVISPESKDLIWESLVDVETRKLKDSSGLFARIEATAVSTGWTLQFREQSYSPWDLEERKFTVDVPLEQRENTIEVVATGPENKKIQFKLLVTSQAPEVPSEGIVAKVFNGFKITAVMGASSHEYSESSTIKSSFANLSVGALVSKVFTSPSFEFSGKAIYEGINIVKPTGDGALNFLSLDGSFGYLTGDLESTFRLGVFAGLFYRTTNGSNYGYRSLTGPMVSPTLRFKLGEGQRLHASYHYLPIFTKGMGVTPASEIESVIEAGWTKKLDSGRDFSILLNSTELKIEGVNTELKSQSTGLLFGYGF